MGLVARQTSSDDGSDPAQGSPGKHELTLPLCSLSNQRLYPFPRNMNVVNSDTASQDSSGATTTDVQALGTTDTALTNLGATTTAAVSNPDSATLPASASTDQTFTTGASDASGAETLTVVSVQATTSGATSLDSSQSISDTQTSSIDSSTASIGSVSITSETSIASSSTLSPTTIDSTSSTSSSTSDSSSTQSESTSLTTSFTEIVTTINGKVTTVVSPVATLNAETSSSVTSSNRTAIIAGATAGGVALIILCLLAIFMCRRRQKRRLEQSHRYLPTPRSVMLAGEDDFDLAAGPSQPRRGFSLFGSRRNGRNNDDVGGADDYYRDLGSDSGRDVNSPVMRELPSEPPPRLLRPVASKTGSYFQEAVWPPPDEGSQLVDPLMAASNVDLHSIVDEVMGPQGGHGQNQNQTQNQSQIPNQSRRWSGEAEASSSTSSPPRPARLRGGAGDTTSSIYSESGTPTTDFNPRIPSFTPMRHGHGESPTMSSVESGFSDSPRHLRDWSTDSATGLLSNMDRSTRRSSGGSGSASGSGSSPWLSPGSSPPSAYTYAQGRAMSPTLSSPLRMVSEPPQQMFVSLPTPSPTLRAREKASEAAQERRGSLVVSNPNPEDVAETGGRDGNGGNGGSNTFQSTRSYTTHSSLSISTSSTQRLRRLAGSGSVEAPGTGAHTPYPDESPIDRRSVPPSLAHAWLLDTDEEDRHDIRNVEAVSAPRPAQTQTVRLPREEIPPRYDMIRRDSEDVDAFADGDGDGPMRTRSLR